MPKITNDCMSCGMCFEECLQGAIQFEKTEGAKYAQAYIVESLCIDCGNCLNVDCPGDAIKEK